MLEAINIVKGAVSTKDLIPVFTHIALHEGRVHGFNGRIHISAPAPKQFKDLSFTVPMVPFVAAVQTCEGDLHLEPFEPDQLCVTNGKGFSANMPTGKMDAYPMEEPEGKRLKVRALLPVLAALQPFIGQDSTRPWSAGIRFQGLIAMATNNVVLVEAGLTEGPIMPSICLPVFAVEEVLRLGVEPQSLAVTGNHATFYFPGGVWLRTSLLEDLWPDTKAILKGCHHGAALNPLPAGLYEAVGQVLPFVPNPKFPVIRFLGEEGVVATENGVTSAVVGGFQGGTLTTGSFHSEPLLMVLKIADRADLSRHPRVPWSGQVGNVPVSGVLLGLAP